MGEIRSRIITELAIQPDRFDFDDFNSLKYLFPHKAANR